MIGQGRPLGNRNRLEQSWFEHIDWPLFVVAALIAVLGVVNLYSATSVYFGTRRAGLSDIYITKNIPKSRKSKLS